jgi:pimeloyl-ACP methyl ester carboxylesterase
MGATTSLLAAAAEPYRSRALVLFEPVLIGGVAQRGAVWDSPITQTALRRRDTFPDRAAAMEAYRGRGAFRTWTEAQLADYVQAGFRDTAAGEVSLSCAPQWEALAAIDRPVRIFKAETDSTGASDGAHAAEIAANACVRLQVIPGTTHFLPMERPELVREALREAAL